MKRKICCVFVTIMLITSNLVSAYASATPTVVVSGGTMATGGLASGYSSKSEMAAISLVMVMIRSLGMTVHLSQQAIEAGQTAYTVVRGKFREWAGETDGSSALQPEVEENLRDKFEVINGGSSSDPEGKLYFTPAVAKLVQKFVNWLKQTNSIGDSNQQSSGAILNGTFYGNTRHFLAYAASNDTSNGKPYTFVSTSQSQGVEMSQQILKDAAWCAYPIPNHAYGMYGIFCYVPKSQGQVRIAYHKDGSTIPNYYIAGSLNSTNDYYYYYWAPSGVGSYYGVNPSTLGNLYVIPYDANKNTQTNIKNYLDGLNGSWNAGGEAETGIQAPGGDVDSSQLDNPDDKPVVVDPGIIPQLNPQQDTQLGIGDYIDLLRQVLNQESDPAQVPQPVPALDPATETPVALPVPDALPVPLPWTVTLPSDQDAPQDVPEGNTPVTDPDSPADPEIAVPEMSVVLDDYFPFCIPFDIYHLLQKFSAEPVTPQVHLSFDVPRMNISIPLDIDLSPFNGVASVARKMETVSYTVGLALITRKTILRG